MTRIARRHPSKDNMTDKNSIIVSGRQFGKTLCQQKMLADVMRKMRPGQTLVVLNSDPERTVVITRNAEQITDQSKSEGSK